MTESQNCLVLPAPHKRASRPAPDFDLFYLKTKQYCGASRKRFSKQYNTIFNVSMRRHLQIYKLTNDVGRTSKGNQTPKSLP